MPKYEIVVLGSACCDIIFWGLPSSPQPGKEIWTEGVEVTAGGAINTAAALSRLGLKVGLASLVGHDFFGQVIKAKMKEENISLQFVQQLNEASPQVTVALNYDGDRSFVSYGDDRETESFQDHMRNVIHKADAPVFHFSSSPRKGHTAVMEEAKKAGKMISLDTGWDEEWLQSNEIKEQIGLADIFMPNLPEAQLITNKQDPYDALQVLAAWVPTAVIKRGTEGAVCSTDGKIYSVAARQADVVDSTGAGDCFIAGFLYGWIKQKQVQQCLAIGNFSGGSAVSSIGGYNGAPYEQDVLSFLAEQEHGKRPKKCKISK
jgi:sugar/nucleoside kinase (ribokinase family)